MNDRIAAIAMTESTYAAVLEVARRSFRLDLHSDHGQSHWLRVEKFGLYVGERTRSDLTVVRLFARLHDCRRENEFHDPQHGHRAADVAASLRGTLISLSDAQFGILDYAMRYHNDGLVSDDPTIGACWDADRLDLPRVGIEPNAKLMSTECGRLPSTLEWVRNIQVADGVIAGG